MEPAYTPLLLQSGVAGITKGARAGGDVGTGVDRKLRKIRGRAPGQGSFVGVDRERRDGGAHKRQTSSRVARECFNLGGSIYVYYDNEIISSNGYNDKFYEKVSTKIADDQKDTIWAPRGIV
ncbi:hypothetical protein G5I_13422 [Acromyrmex echinatior]|uniref:Uncharacterized protein n=1 Tax=Acromyrmex echinatior TaxID=103372 RepID=F4X4Z9_ACREC|nr:hypothetical protein G5I_13422 [Acromyrmex echinatior]